MGKGRRILDFKPEKGGHSEPAFEENYGQKSGHVPLVKHVRLMVYLL